MAVVLTEPSIKVVPAGRCSSTIRKSRSHSGVFAGMLRRAVMATRALPPSATWLARFSNGVGLTATPKPDRQHLAVELGRGRVIDPPVDTMATRLAAVLVRPELAGEARRA